MSFKPVFDCLWIGILILYNYLGGVEGNVLDFSFFLPMAMGSVVIIANEAKFF